MEIIFHSHANNKTSFSQERLCTQLASFNFESKAFWNSEAKWPICTCSTHFCLSLPLFCTTTMPFYTTKTSNFPVSHKLFLRRNCRMCLPKILFPVFMFSFIFSLSLSFTLLAARISHFRTAAMKFSCFSSNKIRLLCFQALSLALPLLSTCV